jgi:hypothetical protein
VPIEVDLRLGPACLHQRQRFVETGDGPVGIDAEGLKRAPLPAGRDADLETAIAQAVQRADRLG